MKKDLSDNIKFVSNSNKNKVVDNDEVDGYNDVTFNKESAFSS